jgi:hypothetical protein
MRLKDLSDWSRISQPQSIEGILRGARPSQLGHFLILDVEYLGTDSLVLIMVGSHFIKRVLLVLKDHIGRPMREIGELEIDV